MNIIGEFRSVLAQETGLNHETDYQDAAQGTVSAD